LRPNVESLAPLRAISGEWKSQSQPKVEADIKTLFYLIKCLAISGNSEKEKL
jgi:hypothetical protein